MQYHRPSIMAAPQIEPILSGNPPPGFDSSTCCSVYVGNIHPQVAEPLLQEVFSAAGPIERCKLIKKDKSSYGFVDYFDSGCAALAIATLNGRLLFGQPIKVNWVYASSQREDTSEKKKILLFDRAIAARKRKCFNVEIPASKRQAFSSRLARPLHSRRPRQPERQPSSLSSSQHAPPINLQEELHNALRNLTKGAQQAAICFRMASVIEENYKKECEDHLHTKGLLDKALTEVKCLEERIQELISQRDSFRSSSDSLLQEKEKLSKQVTTFNTLKEEHKEKCKEYEKVVVELNRQLREVGQKLKENKTAYDSLHSSFKMLKDELNACQHTLDEFELIKESVTQSAIKSAVRAYRESSDCHNRKVAYSAAFFKLGFYAVRTLLERSRPSEQFPELVYSDRVERDFNLLGWEKYEPEATPYETELEYLLYDELDNLSGPWEFVGKNGVPSDDAISVHSEDYERKGLDNVIDEDVCALPSDALELPSSEPLTTEGSSAPQPGKA